jgi:signal transduction histidine kinase/DNA-binding LacI/PurR family transcriptional regulator
MARLGRMWGQDFLNGITNAARSLDINLLCFVGGVLNRETAAAFSLYDLASADSLDGVILSPDLGHAASAELLEQFTQRYSALPVVAVSLELPGVPAILSDNFNGMRQAIEHLIETHHCERIAFIQGPPGQPEAEQRYQAYLAVLEAHAIPFNPALVASGDFSPESGRLAVRTLLDERGAEFQALVTANDRMAFGALEALEAHNRRVPGDVALVGFDDIQEAQALVVPLTTVRQPFYDYGQKAVETLVSLLRGETPPPRVVMPTELVLRWSCGCLPSALQQVSFEEPEVPTEPIDFSEHPLRIKALRNRRQIILGSLQQAFNSLAPETPSQILTPVMNALEGLWDKFLSDLEGESDDLFPKQFAQAITAGFKLSFAGQGAGLWQGLLSEFRRQVLPYLPDRRLVLRAENSFEQARILIGEVAQRAQSFQHISVEHQEEMLQSLGHSLASLVSLRDMCEAAVQHFPGLKIDHCHMALYEPGSLAAGRENLPAAQGRLLLEYDHGLVECNASGKLFPLRQLAPPGCIPADRRFGAILSELSFSQNRMGFLLTEIGPGEWEIYIRLANLLSSGLFRALLIKEREDAMQEVGKLLVSAEQHSIELAIAKDSTEKAAQRMRLALQETENLFEAARLILGATDIGDICSKLSQNITKMIRPEQVSIYLVDPGREEVLFSLVDEKVNPPNALSYAELDDGPSRIVLHTALPVLSTDADDGTETLEGAARRRRAGIGPLLVAPFHAKDQVIGVVVALNRIDQRIFNQHDMDLLISLTTQATAAIENARLYQAEQERRQVAESLVQAGRKLTSSLQLNEVPGQILEQLALVVPYERASLILQEGESMRIVAQRGFPDDERAGQLQIQIRQGDVYQQVCDAGRPLIVDDVTRIDGWQQVDWLPLNQSWMGVPLFAKEQVIGMLSITRRDPMAFSQDDSILVSTFALQAAIALENAGLYDRITRFNEQLEEMVQQRTEELNQAYQTLEKLDQNKTDFINVAAHELRTPLTVIKGYMDMLAGDAAVRSNAYLKEVVGGVLKGTERLHGIINSMLDVARIDSQLLDMHMERTSMAVTLRRIQADFQEAAAERNLTIQLDDLEGAPHVKADPTMLLKVYQNLVGNAIKYTPDGGTITLSWRAVTDAELGECVETLVRDTGIGIDPEYQELIFEKFYQTGTVALHSSGETKFKGGGPGLGLAIVRGIIQAHGGRIWMESPGYDELTCPGSTFHILLPVG